MRNNTYIKGGAPRNVRELAANDVQPEVYHGTLFYTANTVQTDITSFSRAWNGHTFRAYMHRFCFKYAVWQHW